MLPVVAAIKQSRPSSLCQPQNLHSPRHIPHRSRYASHRMCAPSNRSSLTMRCSEPAWASWVASEVVSRSSMARLGRYGGGGVSDPDPRRSSEQSPRLMVTVPLVVISPSDHSRTVDSAPSQSIDTSFPWFPFPFTTIT